MLAHFRIDASPRCLHNANVKRKSGNSAEYLKTIETNTLMLYINYKELLNSMKHAPGMQQKQKIMEFFLSPALLLNVY